MAASEGEFYGITSLQNFLTPQAPPPPKSPEFSQAGVRNSGGLLIYYHPHWCSKYTKL